MSGSGVWLVQTDDDGVEIETRGSPMGPFDPTAGTQTGDVEAVESVPCEGTLPTSITTSWSFDAAVRLECDDCRWSIPFPFEV